MIPETSQSRCKTYSLLNLERLQIPDHISVLLDAPVAAEEAHSSHTSNALLEPSILVLVRFINQLVRLDITVEIVRHKVVITLVDDAIAESGELASVAKFATFDGIEHLCEVRIELEVAVVVSVAEIFYVFC